LSLLKSAVDTDRENLVRRQTPQMKEVKGMGDVGCCILLVWRLCPRVAAPAQRKGKVATYGRIPERVPGMLLVN